MLVVLRKTSDCYEKSGAYYRSPRRISFDAFRFPAIAILSCFILDLLLRYLLIFLTFLVAQTMCLAPKKKPGVLRGQFSKFKQLATSDIWVPASHFSFIDSNPWIPFVLWLDGRYHELDSMSDIVLMWPHRHLLPQSFALKSSTWKKLQRRLIYTNTKNNTGTRVCSVWV